jgi:parallel beta-helix repeat protein
MTQNTAFNNSNDGFWLIDSDNNSFIRNTAYWNSLNGFIVTSFSNNNIFINNTLYRNFQSGFFLASSNYNLLTNNTANNNTNSGFYLETFSHNNTMFQNTASYNDQYGFDISSSDNNTLVNNSIHKNYGYGIHLFGSSSDNNLYFNNFIENNQGGIQAYDDSGLNNWTNGSAGNYWSDYTGTDANGDGIGDTPYYLDGGVGAQDPHPLMNQGTMDLVTPIINNPSESTFFEGTTGNTLTWNATDINPATYIIYQNGSVVASGTWTSGIEIVYNLDNISFGVHNFTLVVSDLKGNTATGTVIVTVIDNIAPVLDLTNDFTINETARSIDFQWTATDAHPATHTLYQNGSIISSGMWDSGSMVAIHLDLDALFYESWKVFNFTIVVHDLSGNTVNSTLIVTVISEISSTTSILSTSNPTSTSTPISISTTMLSTTQVVGFEVFILVLGIFSLGLFRYRRKE